MVIVEKSFPRGGIPVSKDKSSAAATNVPIFGAVQKKFRKPKTKSLKNQLGEFDDQNKGLETFSAVPLSYETIQDGMIIMGMVKKVDQLFLNVALPGRIAARVSAIEISESYTRAMKAFLQNTTQNKGYKSLKELYREGQIIYCRVLEVKSNEKGNVQVDVSLKPAQIHAELNHTSIRKGFVFNGAVEEVQEHGYIIESGIKSMRCFLPIDKSQPGHTVGEIIYLKVEKITSDNSASTCICKQVTVDKAKVKDQCDPNLDYLLPSTIVKFQVSKHLKDGLKGTIMNETFSAYVNEHQLSDTFALAEDFEINAKYEGRILYVMPLTKLVYVSLNLHNNTCIVMENGEQDNDRDSARLNHGDVVLDAKVHHLGTGGVVLCLNDKLKGVLSYKRIKANYKGNYDQDELLTKYAKESKHKVRILDYDIMDSLYICTDESSMVNEKFFALDDLHPGEVVTATVKSHEPKVGGYKLQVGKVKAIMEKLYLSPSAKTLDINTKIKCRIVAISHERKIVYLTNRSEYMSTNCNIITSTEEAKINSNYTGTVVKSSDSYALIKFFADTKGILFYQGLSGSVDRLEEGQTMQFRVVNKKDDQLVLGLVENIFKVGEICPVSIVNKLDSGLEIKVAYGADEEGEKDLEFKGLIPTHLLSEHVDLLRAKLQILKVGEQAEAACVSGSIFSLRDVKYFLSQTTLTWKAVKSGDVLKAYVKDVNDEVVDIMLPINGYSKTVKVHLNMMLMDAKSSANIVMSKDQVIYVKILSKVEITKTLSISAKLTDVWDCQLATTAGFVEGYLNEVKSIKKALKKQGNPIGRCIVGEKVTAVFQCVNSATKDWEYTIEKFNVTGIVKSWVVGKAQPPKEGTKQDCVIVWVDYSNNLVIISHKTGDIEHISAERQIPENLVGKSNVNAKVLFKNESVFVCSLKKGQHPLVYCPVQLHVNDFEKSASLKLTEGQFCKLSFIHSTLPIAVLDDTYKIWTEFNRKRKLQTQQEVKAKKMKIDLIQKEMKMKQCELSVVTTETKSKRKRNISESIPEKKNKPKEIHEDAAPSKVPATPTVMFYEDKTPDIKSASKVLMIEGAIKTPDTSTLKSLTGISDFWTTDLANINKKDNSSEEEDDSEDENGGESKPKKKLSAAEKFKQQKEEEARLRAIEDKYADPTQLPDTVDQFDRLVLSEPNNSKHWINYMVFHLQSTEIDKARGVARRALKTINFRNLDDQVNIWVALLNLELRYGNKESFNDTLKEALMYNEPLKIYLRAVEIITDAQKNQELIEMVGVITKKFKAEQEMWKVAANALFTIGMTERAQQMLHKALACLPERDHVNTIVMFANLNHRHSHNEMAQTLLDQVITSYPKRVDVWCQYVDMLIKEDLIDSARNILERAVLQKIPLRKMRTIFKKYLEFEERYGTDANVQRVKQLAIDYVKKSENL